MSFGISVLRAMGWKSDRTMAWYVIVEWVQLYILYVFGEHLDPLIRIKGCYIYKESLKLLTQFAVY